MSKDIVTRFGARVKQVRAEKKITQMELCYRTGMEQKTLSAVENGKMEPCLKNVDILAAGLGVTLSQLFKGL